MVLAVLVVPATARADAKSDRAEVQRKKAAVAAADRHAAGHRRPGRGRPAHAQRQRAAQTASLRDAERKSAEAEAALEAATAQVEAKQAEIVDLDAAVKELAIAAYIRPPSSAGLIDSLAAENIGEAELKQSLLEAKSANQLDVLDQLERAREDLETARAAAEQAADGRRRTTGRRSPPSSPRSPRPATSRPRSPTTSRPDSTVASAEAASLADLDKKLSDQIAAEQARIAAELAKQRAARPSRRAAAGQPSRSPVPAASSRSAASRSTRASPTSSPACSRRPTADGISLSGGGYRSSSGQIQTRRNNCGTSNYDVYQKSPSQCSPPTARPGSSMHERGLAIDFTYNGRIINSRSSPAYQWLNANAARYGFYNLPSEPWHWSVNGN